MDWFPPCSQGAQQGYSNPSGGAKAVMHDGSTLSAATGKLLGLVYFASAYKSSRFIDLSCLSYDCADHCSNEGLLASIAEVFSTENPHELHLGFFDVWSGL